MHGWAFCIKIGRFFLKFDTKRILMTYKEEDWKTACERLEKARQEYLAYVQLERKLRKSSALDTPIFHCWTFGEYAINVALECLGLRPAQDHSQPSKAKDLAKSGSLARDYSSTLEKLERFRKKAAHLGYVRDRSTHYSSADLNNCLTEMEALRLEVEALLRRTKGRQP